jgi:hypothetical protein
MRVDFVSTFISKVFLIENHGSILPAQLYKKSPSEEKTI